VKVESEKGEYKFYATDLGQRLGPF
jgi:hypothetical protein